jgi:hypothetical protein
MKKTKINLDPFLGNSGGELDFYITKPVFSISDMGVPKEDLILWVKEGLLNTSEIIDDTKFNLEDYMRIQIIQQLLGFCVQLCTIKKVFSTVNEVVNVKELIVELQKNPPPDFESKERKEAFQKNILDIDPENFNGPKSISSLQYLISYYILDQKEQVYLVVYPNGDCVFPWYEGHAYTYAPEELERITYQPHIRISLTAIVRKFISSEKAFDLPFHYRLNNPAYHLMDKALSGSYSEIVASFKNRNIEALELTQQVNPKTKITEIMKGKAFGNVTVIKHDGRISRIISTRNVRFK